MARSSTSFRDRVRGLPRNVWAVSLTSFFMDISSEMVINILPLFLESVLGVKIKIIGLIEAIAEATASILKVFSGWLSDKLRARKWLAVAGYGISALAKPFFYIANTWGLVAGVRWADRVGKGVRTAPRDALVADSIDESQRGLAFGFHRAADTAGAVLGLLIALLVVWLAQQSSGELTRATFQTVVLISLIPATLAVIALAVGTQEVAVTKVRELPRISFKGLGKPFLLFMVIVGIFDLGNSSDAFLVLRAQERGAAGREARLLDQEQGPEPGALRPRALAQGLLVGRAATRGSRALRRGLPGLDGAAAAVRHEGSRVEAGRGQDVASVGAAAPGHPDERPRHRVLPHDGRPLGHRALPDLDDALSAHPGPASVARVLEHGRPGGQLLCPPSRPGDRPPALARCPPRLLAQPPRHP